MNPDFYGLLAADFSPVALIVLNGDDRIIRHANRAFLQILGGAHRAPVQGRRLADIAPDVEGALRSLLETVAETGRPRRAPGLSFPFPDPDARRQAWDVACAPLPPNDALTPPDVLGVWLWPEEPGATSSRRVVEALNANLRDRLPTRIPEYEVAAALVPSEPGAALGGDTYDWVPLGNDRWGILMADVSGRGPAAAARAITIRHSARALLVRHGPAQALTLLSRLLLADPSFTGFATTFLGVLDTAAGMLVYVSAGHEPALILRGDSNEIEEITGDGALPLAVDDAVEYLEHATPLTTRDVLLLYTDGLTDTRRDEEFFDEERLRAALLKHHNLPAPALVATLLAEAEAWAGPNALRDDTALLVVHGEDA